MGYGEIVSKAGAKPKTIQSKLKKNRNHTNEILEKVLKENRNGEWHINLRESKSGAISIEEFRNLDSLVPSDKLWQHKKDMGFSMDDLCVLFLGASEYIQKAINDPTLRTVEMAERLGWLFGFAPSALIPRNAHHECQFGGLLESVRNYQAFRLWQMELLKEMRNAYETCSQAVWTRQKVLFMREARQFFSETVESQRRLQYSQRTQFNKSYFLPNVDFKAGRVYRFKPRGPFSPGTPASTEYFEFAFQCRGRGWLKHYVFLEPEGRTRRSFTQVQLRDFEICYVKDWRKNSIKNGGDESVS